MLSDSAKNVSCSVAAPAVLCGEKQGVKVERHFVQPLKQRLPPLFCRLGWISEELGLDTPAVMGDPFIDTPTRTSSFCLF
jgi:hypothetical protein